LISTANLGGAMGQFLAVWRVTYSSINHKSVVRFREASFPYRRSRRATLANSCWRADSS
jgi:hypothetical protein